MSSRKILIIGACTHENLERKIYYHNDVYGQEAMNAPAEKNETAERIKLTTTAHTEPRIKVLTTANLLINKLKKGSKMSREKFSVLKFSALAFVKFYFLIMTLFTGISF